MNKKAIIIGATSGIGRELAKLFVEEGYFVGITGRRSDLLKSLKNENPDRYFIKLIDVTKTSIISDQLNELVHELGDLEILVICAGSGDLNKNLDFEIEKDSIETNVSGFTAVADWAYNFFEKRKEGHLVAISSIAGLRGSRHAPAYNASKSFQINYLEGLRQKADKLKQPIIITDIRPGFVNTAMAKGNGLFWVSTVEKAAKQIYKAIKKKKKIAYVTKRWITVALFLKISPAWFYKKL